MPRPTLVLLATVAVLGFAAQLAPLAAGAQETEIPVAYIGRWQGTATQINPLAEWLVTIELSDGEVGAVVGSIGYPSQQCGGDLTLSLVNGDAELVELTESLTYGDGACADGGTVVLERQPNGALQYRWSHPTVDAPANGLLTSESENGTPSLTDAQAEVKFRFDTGVSAEDEAYVREGIRLAQDFVAVTFGLDVTEPVTVEVQSSDPGRSSAEARDQHVSIRTAHPVWITSNALQKTKIVVHEYFHVLQGDLLNGHEPWPIWLQEGAAEYVGFLAVAERGLVPYDAARDYHYGGAAYSPLLALVEMESWEGFSAADQACCAYSLSPLAVEILTAERGIDSITDYYALLGRGEDPEDAFEAAFGVELNDFYAMFAGQQQGFAPLGPTHPSVQFAETFVEGAADVTVAAVTSPLSPGDQGVLTAITAPGVPCTMIFSPTAGAGVRTVPVHADAGGNAFWLFSTEPDLARGTATVDVSCGAASVVIDIVLR